MNWQIPIAYQSREQTISEALEAGVDQVLEGEDRDVAFNLLFNAGFKTIGQLLDHIESLDAAGRKALLDRTRKSAGLPTTAELEHVQELRNVRRGDPPRPLPQPQRELDGSLVQECPAEGCNALSTDAGGAIAPARERRWWCDLHRDLAGPRDLEPWEPEPVALDPLSGALVFPEEQRLAAEHYARQAAQREEERRKRQDQLEAEEERIRTLEEQRPKRELRPGEDPYLALYEELR